jgi:hypothetical protein
MQAATNELLVNDVLHGIATKHVSGICTIAARPRVVATGTADRGRRPTRRTSRGRPGNSFDGR